MKIVRNPYLTRAMIRNPDAFFGRRQELARLAARIASDPPQSTALIGDRRIGKSSLLYYVSHADVSVDYLDDPDRTVFLFMDFQEEQRLGIEEFFGGLLRRLHPLLEGKVDTRVSPDTDGLRSVLEGIDRAGCRLILLLDEFDRVTHNASFDPDFFAYLRSLAGHHNVAYFTSSSRDLQQLCHSQEISDSPFFNIFSTVRLGPMARDEALGLIEEPSQSTPFPLSEHAELILELAGHLPFFLQIGCSAVFETLVEEGECVRERVCERFLEEARPHFQYYWEHFDPVSRALCSALASGQAVDQGRPEYQDLVKRGFILDEGSLFSCLFAGFVRGARATEMGIEPLEVQAERLHEMERELEAARATQMGLLPQEKPEAAGLDVAGRCVPASHVGGDFYTYVWLDEAHTMLGVVVVDVMGHGMAAAVTALRFSETLRYETRGLTRPAAVLGGLNRALCETLEAGSFVGCCMGVLDLQQRTIQLSAGGHYLPLVYRRGEDRVFELEMGNLPLGTRADVEYGSMDLELEAGDVLLFYSDGVVEAQDDREDQYGHERLQELLLGTARDGVDAEGIVERLFRNLGRFSASVGQTDDITTVALRVL